MCWVNHVREIRINVALCAMIHRSSHQSFSSLRSPHAFHTILAFSIHSFMSVIHAFIH